MKDVIKKAIKIHQGEHLAVGTVCAHPSDRMTYVLKAYEGDVAVLYWQGKTKRFPASEIFDPNKVNDTALSLEIEKMFRMMDAGEQS